MISAQKTRNRRWLVGGVGAVAILATLLTFASYASSPPEVHADPAASAREKDTALFLKSECTDRDKMTDEDGDILIFNYMVTIAYLMPLPEAVVRVLESDRTFNTYATRTLHSYAPTHSLAMVC